MRDINFFLIKEVSKAFVYLQLLMREFHQLNLVKEYLFAELTMHCVQNVILKQELHASTGGQLLIDPKALQKQIHTYENNISSLEVDNNKMKASIVDLNARIKV